MSLKRIALLFPVTLALLGAVIVTLMLTTTSASAPVSERPTWADAFVQDYEAKHGDTDTATEQLLLAGANASCGDLVAGNNLSQVWQMNVDRGMSSDQSATVIELAVKYYCPQYRYLFTGPFIPKEEV